MFVESTANSGNGQVQASRTTVSSESSVPSVGRGDEKGPSAPDMSKMREIAADLRENIKVLSDVDLDFAIHRPSGQVVVTVTDEKTGKVIREIPEREMLNLAAKLEEMMGVIFDQRA